MPRDIIVIGASAGGVGALMELAGGLPADLAAAVFVVLHVAPYAPSYMPEILGRAGPLVAVHPEDGEGIRRGRIYVAPPDHHLLLEREVVRVTRGPKENRFRPSIDALFRSAAYVHGPRVIGVVLSGALDDGTSGLWTVKRLGGVAVVQEPVEAPFPEMPLSALRQVEVDHTVDISTMAPLLAHLAGQKAPEPPPASQAERQTLEAEIAVAIGEDAFEIGVADMGEPTRFTCPECHGALRRLREGGLTRFRCHTGHAFTPNALLAAVGESVEDTLWQAVRGLQESAMLLEHMGRSLADAGQAAVADAFLDKAREAHEQADAVRRAALQGERFGTAVSGEG